MRRIQGYTLQDPDGQRSPICIQEVADGFELRRDATRTVEDFRGVFTLEEARQLQAALTELLPQSTTTKPVDDDVDFP